MRFVVAAVIGLFLATHIGGKWLYWPPAPNLGDPSSRESHVSDVASLAERALLTALVFTEEPCGNACAVNATDASAIANAYFGGDVQVALAFRISSPADVEDARKRDQARYYILRDLSGDIAKHFGVEPSAAIVVIDDRMNVVYRAKSRDEGLSHFLQDRLAQVNQ